MLLRAAAAALLALLAAAFPAAAEVGASGTRLSVGGGPVRAYMTYGHAEDPELYAPITGELRRLQITFQERGEDYLVFHRGAKVAEWPVVRSREDVPETGEHPCVLVMGGNVFVPVRKLAELLTLDVRWEKRQNLVALTPGRARLKVPVASVPPPSAAAGVEEAAPVTLSAVEVALEGEGVQVRVRASAPIRPRWLTLKNPARIVLDFDGAQWTAELPVPEGAGSVQRLRVGYPVPGTARLVLEVDGAPVRLMSVRVQESEVLATVGPGPEARVATISPADEARLIRAIRRRSQDAMTRLPDRHLQDGAPLDGSTPNPLQPPAPVLTRPRALDPLNPAAGTNLAGRVICVDAGHGGKSAGARGLHNLEKDLCLKMSLELRRALQARGATVIMPRESDVYVSLDERCAFANNASAEIFISIHCNSMPRRNTQSGSETYWRTPQSLRLAQSLHPRLVEAVKGRDGGIRNQSFAVIRETLMPSVLLEVAYINNSRDELLLADGDFHANLAESVAEGVVVYFSEPGG